MIQVKAYPRITALSYMFNLVDDHRTTDHTISLTLVVIRTVRWAYRTNPMQVSQNMNIEAHLCRA